MKCKGISFTNRRNKTGPRIDPCSTPCLTGFGSDVIYALVSQTVVTLLNTIIVFVFIETMPFYLRWHHTLIILSIIDGDQLRRKLYGNHEKLFP